MRILKTAWIFFRNRSEIEQVLHERNIERKNAEREARKSHLKLCEKHQQESNQSHFHEDNCDFCKLQKQLLKGEQL